MGFDYNTFIKQHGIIIVMQHVKTQHKNLTYKHRLHSFSRFRCKPRLLFLEIQPFAIIFFEFHMMNKTLNLFNFPCIRVFSNPLIHQGGYRTHLYHNIMASDPSIAVYISNITLNISLQMYIHSNNNVLSAP
jgi:hypothetical protein